MSRKLAGRWHREGFAIGMLVATFSMSGCSDDISGSPPPSGVGASSSAVLVPSVSPAVGEALFVSGDTVAVLGSNASSDPAAIHVTSLDPSLGPPAPLRSLDVSAGISDLRVGDRFLAWIRPGLDPADPDRLRVYDTNDLGTPSVEDEEWIPPDATSVDVLDFDLAGDSAAWIGWLDDDRTEPPRVGVAELADGSGRERLDFGEVLGSFPEIAASDRLIVWHDDRDVYAVERPFDRRERETIADAVDEDMGIRVDGEVAAWESDGDVYVFDSSERIRRDENPRNVGRGKLLELSGGYALYVDFNVYYVLDVTDRRSNPRLVYREAIGEDHPPKLGGRFVAWSICQNVDSITLITTVYFCAADPDTSVYVLDLFVPTLPGTNPREVAIGSERLRLLDLDDVGVAWRTRGSRSELRYWNPGQPLVESVNPLPVYVGSPDPESIDLSSRGLVFPVDFSTEADSIRFVDIMTLLLMTDDEF